MLGSVRYQIRINRDPEDVWKIVGDVGNLADWFPDFASSSLEGTIRTITTNNGTSLDEEILIVDPLLRRISYRLTLPLLKYHRGIVDVLDIEDGTSLVLYTTESDPRSLSLGIGAATHRALKELKRQMEEN